MSAPTAEQLIAALGLKPLPREGGLYRETYRSPLTLPTGKNASTAIYYLLTPDTCSALHRLPTDELFHFYLGDPVTMIQLDPRTRAGRLLTLGPDVLAGQQVQAIVPAGVWQGSFLTPGGSFALMGTTMAPGFDFADYEAGDVDQLNTDFPDFAEPIAACSRVIP
jgi:predicted cupin superfamily sugar epimerase